jgi:hypothetical protein
MGLVDATGGMREAVVAARKAASLDAAYYISLPRPRSIVDVLSGPAGGVDARRSALVGLLDRPKVLQLIGRSRGAAYMIRLMQLLQAEPVLAAMPHYLAVK